MEIIDYLAEQIRETPALDWAATVASIVYVWLAARDNNWCWLFAAIGSLMWAHQMLVVYGLPSDAVLQLFYLLMAAVGIYQWRRKAPVRTGEVEMLDHLAVQQPAAAAAGSPIRRMTPGEHFAVLTGGVLLGYGLGSFMAFYRPGADMYYWDGITTTFSILATFLLIARRIENWIYFIVIDAVYVYIYLVRGADLYALIMLVYIVVAVYGYLNWRQLSADRLAVDRGHQSAT